MSYLNQLLEIAKPKVSSPSQPFSLMSMFKKPNKVQVLKEQKQKEEHPYIRDIKKYQFQRAKQLEERINQERLTIQQRELKKKLEISKKNFVRVQNGKQIRYQNQSKKKGFAELVEVKWESDKKIKQNRKEKSNHCKISKKDSERLNFSIKQQSLQRNRKQQFRSIQPPPPIKKHKKQNRYENKHSDERYDLGDFICDQQIDGNEKAFRELRAFTGKYHGKQYRERDKWNIRESTFDQVANEQRRSHVIGAKQDKQEMMREKRIKFQRKGTIKNERY